MMSDPTPHDDERERWEAYDRVDELMAEAADLIVRHGLWMIGDGEGGDIIRMLTKHVERRR